ncbi:MAG: bifunctional riboflavin kinase/FAD synthetase [Bacteroidetes bacterium]|nr:bifunctional riboflavin kinase/FAD synthetase [Bacteroidota bacterium]
MKVYHSLEEVPEIQDLVLTQGTFDGVHRGHKEVLQNVVRLAKNSGGESMLLTFFPHPRLVLYPNDNNLRLLNSIDEKVELVRECGIDHMLILPFTDEIASLEPLVFVRDILVQKLHVKRMVIGHDHRFGKNREGSFQDLMQFGEMFGFKVHEIPASEIEHIAISSTRARKALAEGDLQLANELLGRNYSLSGKVVHGQKLGRSIGIPTANLEMTDSYKLIPKTGVYAVKVNWNGNSYPGAANIGWNPTIEGKGFSIEVHIIDFHEDIYGQQISIELVRFLRNEEKFSNLDALREQIDKDISATKAVFSTF